MYNLFRIILKLLSAQNNFFKKNHKAQEKLCTSYKKTILKCLMIIN